MICRSIVVSTTAGPVAIRTAEARICVITYTCSPLAFKATCNGIGTAAALTHTSSRMRRVAASAVASAVRCGAALQPQHLIPSIKSRVLGSRNYSDGSQHEFDLQLGMAVEVVNHSPLDVVATTSSRDDKLTIQAPHGVQVATAADTPTPTVRVSNSQQQQQQQGEVGSSSPLSRQVSIQLPQRYCSLDTSTAGGRFQLQQMQEASLKVSTQGGPISINRARCTDAALDSSSSTSPLGGGVIQASELSASQVRLHSGGGPINIKRLFGLDVQLTSSRGGVQLGALYGNRASITSGGGGVVLGHGACTGLLVVDSEGGEVKVEGLEGNASLISGGGPIQVHLHERFGTVFIDSAGGDVVVAITPGAAAQLQVAARGGVAVDPALQVTGGLSQATLQGSIQDPGPPTQALQPSSSTTTPPPPLATAGPASTSSSSRGGSRWVSAEEQVMGPAHTTVQWDGPVAAVLEPRAASASLNASRLARAAPALTGMTVGDAGQPGGQTESKGSLTVVAGKGRVQLVACSWMDAVRSRMGQQASK